MNGTSIAIHGTLLGVAGILAFSTWSKPEDDGSEGKHTVAEVWGGTPEKLERLSFEAKAGTLTLEPRQDKLGAYYVGKVAKSPAGLAEERKRQHGVEKHEVGPDGGVTTETTPERDAADAQQQSGPASFISVGEGQELAKKLAPMRALRDLGALDTGRLADFGLKTTQATLRVKIAGSEHTLLFGGTTPGGVDHYVKDVESGRAYVVEGSILRDLESANQRLVERRLHAWDDATVEKVVLHVFEQERTLVRTKDQHGFWSGADKPDVKDETASNWMSKLERLRVTGYEGEQLQPPPAAMDRVVRVDYYDARRQIGTIELIRRAGAGKGSEYVAKTEHTRWYARVLRSTAEQLDQDVSSVLGK